MSGVDPVLYRQLEALPETQVGEILAGEVVASPRPAPRHARVIYGLGDLLIGPYEHGRGGPGGWWILPEPELHLGADVAVPDVAGWRRVRMPHFPDTAAITLAPDWVCEVLSPNSGRKDRITKRATYARHKVSYLWYVDPIARSLDVLRLTDDGWLIEGIYADDDVARAKPFDGIDLPLSDLWPD